jgi:predicted porin
MKKSLLALAVLSAFAGAASAQSSVTLSGAIDLGVVRQNGAWGMATAGSSRTNFTLSGTEDLGGGMRAFFLANHRFRANTGEINAPGNVTGGTTNNGTATPTVVQATSPQYFWRQAWVGLGGGFGDVRLGKMLMPLQDFNGNYDPFGTDTVGSTHTGGLNATVRAVDTIYYRSPSLGGLQLHAAISASDQQIRGECSGCATPATTAVQAAGPRVVRAEGVERPVGLGVVYSAGPLRLALAYDRNVVDQKTIGLYGGYNAGFADLLFQYEKGDRNTTPTATTTTTTPAVTVEDLKRWSIGAKVPVGQWVLKAGYTRWSDEEIKKFGLGLDYNLSKRTQLYTDVGKLSGDGSAVGSLSSANKKARFDAGIFHRF